MNAVSMPFPLSRVAQSARAVLLASDCLRDDAALELGAVLDGVTGKQLKRAGVPTMGAYAVSRALNGGDNNPLYRVAAVFVTMRRLGMGRERALRIIGWLQEIVDAIWPPEEAASLEEALERDSEQDPRDDHLRYLTANGCQTARRQLLAVKREQAAHVHTVILALQQAEAR